MGAESAVRPDYRRQLAVLRQGEAMTSACASFAVDIGLIATVARIDSRQRAQIGAARE